MEWESLCYFSGSGRLALAKQGSYLGALLGWRFNDELAAGSFQSWEVLAALGVAVQLCQASAHKLFLKEKLLTVCCLDPDPA